MKQGRQIQTYLEQVVLGDKTGFKAGMIRLGLSLLEPVYWLLLSLNRLLIKKKSLPLPVLSIGNLVAGGVGKTPMVVWAVRELQAVGANPAVLTRGFARSSKSVLLFNRSELSRLRPEDTGDEPYLLAKFLPETTIAVGSNRFQTGTEALARDHSLDCFIMDDGFQHWRLHRNLDLVILDAANPFGNGHLLPRGILREPLSALRRAEIILLTRNGRIGKADREQLRSRLNELNPRALIAEVTEQAPSITNLNEWLTDQPGVAAGLFLNGLKVAGLTGIGNPKQFETTLQGLGAVVAYFKAYPDHFHWELDTISGLCQDLRDRKLQILVVTAKDAVKLAEYRDTIAQFGLECYVLSLEFAITDQAVLNRVRSLVVQKGAN